MTVDKRDASSTKFINPKSGPATKTKQREMTVEKAKKSARKTISRYKAAMKDLARR